LSKKTQKVGNTGITKALALVVSFRATSESWMEYTKERRHIRYRGRIAKSERTREGSASGGEVLADHSTDGQSGMAGREGGEVMPKRPTEGKEKLPILGIFHSVQQSFERNYGMHSEATNRITKSQKSVLG